MPAFEIHLYRVKFIRPEQASFLHDRKSPKSLFLAALNEKPSFTARNGAEWHIGNLEFTKKNNTGRFAIGRTTVLTIEKYDTETGNFVEELSDSSPHTVVFFDASIGLLGIVQKRSLIRKVSTLAQRIEDVLTETDVCIKNQLNIEVSPIPNPEGFLSHIKKAYRVKAFRATFSGPNPFDADEFFQKPLSVYLNKANGSSGSTQIKGEELNKSVVEEVAKSSAATGNKVSAKIVERKGKRPKTVRMNEDAIVKTISDDTPAKEIIPILQNEYNQVRHDHEF
ncbi:MAG: hypothetical protein AAFN77_17630 [Planctomycetota bacterium]